MMNFNGGFQGRLGEQERARKQRAQAIMLRQLMSPNLVSPLGAKFAAAMQNKDKQMYNMAVAEAMQQLQQESGMDPGFDPHAVFKLATGSDLNAAMHASDLGQSRSAYDMGGDLVEIPTLQPTHPGAGGDMLSQYGFNQDSNDSPVMRRLQASNGSKFGPPQPMDYGPKY